MKGTYKAAIICALALLPTLFFPISCDISIYAMGGKTIADGGKLYVDFLDLKPPAIFVLYAGLYKIVGISPIALRLFDFLLQLTTCLLIYLIFEKRLKKPTAGVWAAIVYALLYASSGYTITMEPESLVGIGCCAIFFALTGRRQIWKYMLVGAIAAYLFAIKYTFGVIGLTALLWILIDNRQSWSQRAKVMAWIAAGAVPALTLAFFPLFDTAALEEFFSVTHYLRYYSSLQSINGEFFRNALKTIGTIFGDNISLTITFAGVMGCLNLIKVYQDEREESRKNLFYFFLMGLFLFVTIAIERKFAYMHFMRVFAPLSVLAGDSAALIFTRLKDLYKTSIISKIVVAALVLFATAFSPIPRYLGLLPPTAYYFVSGTKYANFYQRSDNINQYSAHDQIVKYLDKTVPDTSFVMLIATGANQINYYRADKPYSKFSQSSFLMGAVQIPKWNAEFAAELRRAAYIVIQTNDAHPSITGIPNSSFEWIRKTEYGEYIENNFKVEKGIGVFLIYSRNNKIS